MLLSSTLYRAEESFEEVRRIRLITTVGLIILALLIIPAMLSQAWAAPRSPRVWAKTYGGPGFDIAESAQQTFDGGFVVAGITNSSGAGGFDAWVVRLDSGGGVAWQKAFGGPGDDLALSLQQTSDGGFIAVGCTNTTPRPLFLICASGSVDAWVLRLDSVGDVVWQKAYGGTAADSAVSVQQTSDGGFVVSGFTAGIAWVFKLDAKGNLNWQKAYESFGCCRLPIQQTSDGGFIVAGFSSTSTAGAVRLLKLDGDGNTVWLQTYSGTGFSAAFSLQQTPDDGFVVVGITNGFSRSGGIIAGDFWVLRLDSAGAVVWQKAYGGTGADYAESVQQTSDGGFAVAGWTDSFGAGGQDAWVLKLDASGGVAWQKAYGGAGDELAVFVQQTSDGGFAVAGSTSSTGAGESDILVLKLDARGNIGHRCGFITSTTATVTDTTATIASVTATVTNTSVVGTATSAIVTTTAALTSTQCKSHR